LSENGKRSEATPQGTPQGYTDDRLTIAARTWEAQLQAIKDAREIARLAERFSSAERPVDLSLHHFTDLLEEAYAAHNLAAWDAALVGFLSAVPPEMRA
jgi:hypothetical protein